MPEPTDAPPVDGVPVTIDGQAFTARRGELLIDAAERAGVYIPRFCYHPRMEPVGMCRMCLVEVDTGRGPALQPSCMLTVSPDMSVSTDSEVATKAQDGVLEFLLINHPLDCPVCDKGGECPLQDQTMAYGPGETRYVEEKRHLEKPIPISDLVLLDRERCILCDRCTRFAKDVAGDPLIHFVHRGNQTEVNTFPDEPFASYFSGNTVQICPVGALTATAYRFKARPWDLQESESTCQTCSVGCRVAVQSSRNEVLRYQGVDIDPVNWGWLCDKGRYAFEAVNSEERLGEPLVRDGGDQLRPARWSEALGAATTAIRSALDADGAGSVAVLGGARSTNEGAYAWAKLAKGVLGTDHTDAQLDDGLPGEVVAGLPRATIDDACRPGGTVVLVGPDPKEELPVLYLRLRHAAIHDGVTLLEVVPRAGGLSRHAAATLTYRPGEVADAVRALVGEVPQGKDAGGIDTTSLARARTLLGRAEGPVTVLVGRGSVAESADYVVDAISTLRRALPEARFLSLLRRGNVHGAIDMGLAPGLLPGRTTLADAGGWFESAWGRVPSEPGLDARGILTAAADGKIGALVLLGSDPLADVPDRDLAERALAGAGAVIAVDCFLNESSSRADVVLPAAGFAEVDGTTTNLEGRVSVQHQQVTPPGTARSDWMIAAELAARLDADLHLASVDDVWDEIERLAPSHAGCTAELLASPAAADGIVVPLPAPAVDGDGGAEGAGDGAEAAATPEAADAAVAADEAADTDEEVDAAAEAHAESTDGAEDEGSDADDADGGAPPEPTGPVRPPLVAFTPGDQVPLAPHDAYGLRLVATRKLYDRGVATQRSDHLAGLAPGTRLHLNPYDFDRLGVAPGAEVRVRVPEGVERRRATVAAEPDDGVPRGAAALVVNQPDVDVHGLLAVDEPVVTVRVDSGEGA